MVLIREATESDITDIVDIVNSAFVIESTFAEWDKIPPNDGAQQINSRRASLFDSFSLLRRSSLG
jgi:hypothetical protein